MNPTTIQPELKIQFFFSLNHMYHHPLRQSCLSQVELLWTTKLYYKVFNATVFTTTQNTLQLYSTKGSNEKLTPLTSLPKGRNTSKIENLKRNKNIISYL